MRSVVPGSEIAAGILDALHLVIFERREDGLFRLLGNGPEWFRSIVPEEIETDAFDVAETFPVLEMFLDEALSGMGQSERMRSDLWTERDRDGRDRHLQAVAMQIDGKFVLTLESPEDAQQERTMALQRAHDVQLQAERIERMRRQLAQLNEELKTRNEEVVQATRAKSEFLAAMSHEIRTPMNAILGMADLLRRTPLNAEQRKFVEVFQGAGENLLVLINDILDLSKVEAGKIELESVGFDLVELVTNVVDIVQVRAQKKGLVVSQSVGADVPAALVGDPNRLRQVLLNLVGNSIKFTENGGVEISVAVDHTSSEANALHFVVTDTGIGIPADKLQTVFESFSQADSSTTRKYGGTGLGLSISRQLIALMGGRIWVESEMGSGSCFHFTAKFALQPNQFPAQNRDQVRRERVSEPSISTEDESIAPGLRILLADDSEDNVFLIVSYLKGSGCVVDVAENGRIAVDKFEAAGYDLVLMDVEMPEMDGYTAVRTMRRSSKEQGRRTPILALTAHAFEEAYARSFEAGFTDHLTKPIRRTTLLSAIRKHAPTGSVKSGAELPARVMVDPLLQDLIPGFLEKRRQDVPKLAQALATGDYETVRKLGHNLKGTGAGYGFQLISEVGGRIEEAAKLQDYATIHKSMNELTQYLSSVEWSTAGSPMEA